jgi:hypothetical protein
MVAVASGFPLFFTVSEVADILRKLDGVRALSASMIRYWDQPHAIQPSMCVGATRLYVPQDIALLRLVGVAMSIPDPITGKPCKVSRAALRAALAYCGPQIREQIRDRASAHAGGVVRFDGGMVTFHARPPQHLAVGLMLVGVDALWSGVVAVARAYRATHAELWANGWKSARQVRPRARKWVA